MPLTLSPDELMSFKIMVALIKATKSTEHEIVHKLCQRKGISVDELLDTEGKNGTIRSMLESLPPVPQGRDNISALKRVGMVDLDTKEMIV